MPLSGSIYGCPRSINYVEGNQALRRINYIAIGAFGAAKKGVFVLCSAGNSGPGPLTVTNVVPWITTIAASTVDRSFPAVVKLGNGESYQGTSLYSGPGMGDKLLSVIYAGNASQAGVNAASSALCLDGTLDPAKVKGKIVLCDRGSNARVVKGEVCHAAGVVGFILRNLAVDGEGLIADAHVLPVTSVGADAGVSIFKYIISTVDAQGLITFDLITNAYPKRNDTRQSKSKQTTLNTTHAYTCTKGDVG